MSIRDTPPVNPPRERIFNIPGAVLALVALLVAIHLIMEYLLTDQQASETLSLFAFSPARYAEVVLRWLPAWWGPQLWTFVSYAFFHANFSHLIFNLVWLLAFLIRSGRMSSIESKEASGPLPCRWLFALRAGMSVRQVMKGSRPDGSSGSENVPGHIPMR